MDEDPQKQQVRNGGEKQGRPGLREVARVPKVRLKVDPGLRERAQALWVLRGMSGKWSWEEEVCPIQTPCWCTHPSAQTSLALQSFPSFTFSRLSLWLVPTAWPMVIGRSQFLSMEGQSSMTCFSYLPNLIHPTAILCLLLSFQDHFLPFHYHARQCFTCPMPSQLFPPSTPQGDPWLFRPPLVVWLHISYPPRTDCFSSEFSWRQSHIRALISMPYNFVFFFLKKLQEFRKNWKGYVSFKHSYVFWLVFRTHSRPL